MARVFLAIDEKLDRKVALKVMNQSLAHDPTFRDRFVAEAKDTAKFIHPGIVSIYTTDVSDDNYYLVLEYIESGTLKDRQNARLKFNRENDIEDAQPFSASESVLLLTQLADALAYAHSKKVIHRDIKPANIMFRSDGKAVLTDFGIAKSVTENRELTMTGYSVGTPAYMSPEQKLGAEIDARSDLYSLGVVFYELLTGRKPYRTRSGNYADLRKELDANVPELPAAISYLQPLLNKMLEKDPDRRYQTASELLDALKQYAGTTATVADDATVIQRPVLPSGQAATGDQLKRKVPPKVIAVIASILFVIVAGVIWKFLPEPAPEVVAVDEETAEEIDKLLGVAQIYFDMGNLTSPPSSNASEIYRRIEGLQPGNPDARAGLTHVLDQVTVEIESAIESGKADQASSLIELALYYFPENEKLADLQKQAGG